jgi:hypothetical protein
MEFIPNRTNLPPKFDFHELANSLTQNGHASLPPVDVQRMGTIAGYDPLFSDGDGGSYPAVSVYIAGSNVPTPGCRFASHYTPQIGEMVIITQTGNDAYVLGSLSGSIQQTAQSVANKTVHTAVGGMASVIAHQTISLGTKNKPLVFKDINSSYEQIPGAFIYPPILPNRLYKAEVTVNVIATNSSSSIPQNFSLGIWTPVNGWMSFGSKQVAANSANTLFTINGSVIDSDKPVTPLKPGQWAKKYPDNHFNWYLGIKRSSSLLSVTINGDTNPNNVQMTIYDMGVAS